MTIFLYIIIIMFNKIYYINLERRLDRLNHINNEIDKIKFNGPIERINAIDGKIIDIPKIPNNLMTQNAIDDALDNNAGLYTIMTPGAIGCALSHYNCYTKIINECNDDEYVLILEDDAIIEDNFIKKLKEYLQDIPKYDILFLGFHDYRILKDNNKFHHIPTKLWGLFGYIINKKAAKEFIKIFPLEKQIDTDMHSIFPKLNVFCLKKKYRLIKSELSQEAYIYGTDTQVRDNNNIELFKNIYITNNSNFKKRYNNCVNDFYYIDFIILFLILIIIQHFLISYQ